MERQYYSFEGETALPRRVMGQCFEEIRSKSMSYVSA